MEVSNNKVLQLLLVLVTFNLSCGSKTTSKVADADRPNILFAILDDATYEHMSAYGCSWVNTPNFDRVASDGLLFNRAYTPNAKCAPSRAAIITGRNSWQIEEAMNHWCAFPAAYKTFPEALVDNGYHVGHTAKGWAPGLPGEIDGKPRQLIGKKYSDISLMPPTKAISKIDYTENFRTFLEDNPEDKPFFFWYGSIEPHRDYEFESSQRLSDKKPSDIEHVYEFWPDNDSVRIDMLDYALEIEYADMHLGLMLDMLDLRGELDNTMVIVTADNGMPFPRIKGQEYELSNHLPLAVMWKDGIKNPGRKINDYVNFIDYAPTILDAAGINEVQSGMQSLTGKGWSNIFNSDKSDIVDESRDHILIGKERHDVGRPNDKGYPIRGIFKDGYLLVQNFETDRWPAGNPETGYLNCDGSPTKTVCLDTRTDLNRKKYWEWSFGKRPEFEFYNVADDPECMINMAGDEAMQGLLTQMKDQMYAELKEQGDARLLGNPEIYDTYKYMDRNTANHYNRYMAGQKVKTGWVNDSDYRPIND